MILAGGLVTGSGVAGLLYITAGPAPAIMLGLICVLYAIVMVLTS